MADQSFPPSLVSGLSNLLRDRLPAGAHIFAPIHRQDPLLRDLEPAADVAVTEIEHSMQLRGDGDEGSRHCVLVNASASRGLISRLCHEEPMIGAKATRVK